MGNIDFGFGERAKKTTLRNKKHGNIDFGEQGTKKFQANMGTGTLPYEA